MGEVFDDLAPYFGGAWWIEDDVVGVETFAEFRQSAEGGGDHGAARVEGDGEVADGSRKGVVELSHGGVG